MKKTYWWRGILLAVSFMVLAVSYVGQCEFSIMKCLGGNSIPVTRAASHIFLALLIISSFLFFISDRIFLKWLRFAAAWVILSIILIALTPEYPSGGIMSGPDREMVSIWLGGLFVVLSLGKIIWDSAKERKLK